MASLSLEKEPDAVEKILDKARLLNQEGNTLLNQSNVFQRTLTCFKQFFGNFCYDWQKRLAVLQKKIPMPAVSSTPTKEVEESDFFKAGPLLQDKVFTELFDWARRETASFGEKSRLNEAVDCAVRLLSVVDSQKEGLFVAQFVKKQMQSKDFVSAGTILSSYLTRPEKLKALTTIEQTEEYALEMMDRCLNYQFHGTNYAFLPGMREKGLVRKGRGFTEEVEAIRAIAKRVGIETDRCGSNWFGTYHSSKGKVYVAHNVSTCHGYAVRSPEWFWMFCGSSGEYTVAENHLETRLSKLRDRTEERRKLEMVESISPETRQKYLESIKDLTKEEEQRIKNFFEKKWAVYRKNDRAVIFKLHAPIYSQTELKELLRSDVLGGLFELVSSDPKKRLFDRMVRFITVKIGQSINNTVDDRGIPFEKLDTFIIPVK